MDDHDAAAARTLRRIATASLAWLAGIAVVMVCEALPSAETALSAMALALMLLGAWGAAARTGHAIETARGIVLPLACALLAASVTAWQGRLRLDERLPHALEGEDLVVVGVVAGLPQSTANGLRFRFEPERAHRLGDASARRDLPSRLSIGWSSAWGAGWGDADEETALSPLQARLSAGQRWAFTLRLRRPHGNLNPHGFDVEFAWFEQGIGAVGYVRDAPVPRLLADGVGHAVDRLRQRVRDAVFRAVDDRRAAGLLAALAIGDQSAVHRDDWALFRDTGIAHLVSISGLHVTMFAWLAGALIGAAWRRHPAAPLRLATPHAARWGGLAAAIGYAVVAGWGVPAQRTALMLATVALLASLGLRWPWPLVLLVAAVAVTAIDPWALLQPGFWLSFVAVGLLMASETAGPRRAGPSPQPSSQRGEAVGRSDRAAAGGLATWAWRSARDGLRSQWIATTGLAPLTLVFFQQISVVGFVANLVAIPLVTLVVTPLALLGVAWAPLWTPAAWLAQGLTAFLQALLRWPHAVWTVAAAPAWAQAAGLLAAVVLVLPWSWRLRCLALPLGLPLLWPAVDRPAPGHFELLAADVGQGSAVLVRTRDHLLVFDAGPRYARDSDAGQRVLLPLLRGRGERRVDLLVLSHRDTDHTGGAASLVQGLAVAELLGSLEPAHPLRGLGVPFGDCRDGQRWRWDGVEFAVLHPAGELPAFSSPAGSWQPQPTPIPQMAEGAGRPPRPNALSCVLKITGRSGSALLTGDIERAQELALVARHGDALRADVLLVPHHGSRTSSTGAFLDAVRPQVAVVQAGYRNRFGHPAPDVLARHAERGIRVIDTPRCGAWRWRDDVAPGAADCEREHRRRHWHDVMPPP